MRHHGDDVSSIQFLLDPFCARQISDKMDEVELVLAFVWVHQYADVPEITNKGDGIVITMTNRNFGKIQGDGRKLLDRFKSYFGPQIS